jgi:hypothetical protein
MIADGRVIALVLAASVALSGCAKLVHPFVEAPFEIVTRGADPDDGSVSRFSLRRGPDEPGGKLRRYTVVGRFGLANEIPISRAQVDAELRALKPLLAAAERVDRPW